MQVVIREGRDGMDIAEADYADQRFTASSRNGATMKLARALVEAGAPNEDVSVYGADGRLRFTAPSLHGLARWTIEEGDRGIRQRRWKPSPMGGEAPQDGAEGSGRPADPAEAQAA